MPQYVKALSQPIKTPAGKQEMQWTTELLESLMKIVPHWQAGSARGTHLPFKLTKLWLDFCNDFFRSSSSFLRLCILILFFFYISLLPPPLLISFLLTFSF
jgi:hypothetical protein